MRKSEFTPYHIQKAINAKERLEKARALNSREKPLQAKLDAFYSGKSSDSSNNYDRMEINSYIELL